MASQIVPDAEVNYEFRYKAFIVVSDLPNYVPTVLLMCFTLCRRPHSLGPGPTGKLPPGKWFLHALPKPAG